MGVTIHYDGQLRDEESLDTVKALIVSFAAEHGWPCDQLASSLRTEDRYIYSLDPDVDEEVVPFTGLMHGLKLNPGPGCEPLLFEFAEDHFFQNYCKTQFAGPEVHSEIVDLLSRIQPFCLRLRVEDESGYWISRDRAELNARLESDMRLIQEYAQDRPGSRIAVKRADGRMIDLAS